MKPYKNIYLMILRKPTESRSLSLLIQLFPTSTKSSIGNNPFFTPQNVLVKSSKKHLSSLTVVIPNFRDLLVRAKLKTPNTTLNTTPGTFRCESKHGCLTCPHIDHGRTTYTFTNTGEVRQIKQHITCKSTNLNLHD